MLSFSGSLKVFVAVEACDMRKGFNGLHALVSERLGEDLKQGALFVWPGAPSASTARRAAIDAATATWTIASEVAT